VAAGGRRRRPIAEAGPGELIDCGVGRFAGDRAGQHLSTTQADVEGRVGTADNDLERIFLDEDKNRPFLPASPLKRQPSAFASIQVLVEKHPEK
jgi:hypothetical protein